MGTHRPDLSREATAPRRSTQADDNLLALRGIAALMVAAFHALMWLRIDGDERLLMLPVWETVTFQGTVVRSLLALFNGATAVDLFFVLSGFVLAKAWPDRRLTVRAVAAFYVRRMLRLWPAYAASLALIAVYLGAWRGDFQPWPHAASWMVQFYRGGASDIDWAANLAWFEIAANPVAWSLRIEVVLSACLPMLWLSARYLGGVVALVQIGVAFVVALFCRYDTIGHFFYIFLLGVYGGVFRHELADAVRRLGVSWRAMLPVSIAGLLLPGFITLAHHPLADLSIGLGALGLVLYLTQASPNHEAARPRRWHAALAHCGTLSYSFYLCHFIVLYAVAWALSMHLPPPLLAAWPLPVMLGSLVMSLLLATLVAQAMHRVVERPALRLGARLAARIDTRDRPRTVSAARRAPRR